jgi:hypothetical protein
MSRYGATYSRQTADELLRLVEAERFKLSEVALIPGLTIREIGPEELNTPDDFARAIDLEGEYRSPKG